MKPFTGTAAEVTPIKEKMEDHRKRKKRRYDKRVARGIFWYVYGRDKNYEHML